jgi:hypothetical protein
MLAKPMAIHVASFTFGLVMRIVRAAPLDSSSPSLLRNCGTDVRNRYEDCDTNNRPLEMIVTESAIQSKN